MKQLPKSFFARATVQVAKELLGKVIEVNNFKGRIVETEAYGKDPASHAFKKTERSAIMFDTTGQVYVYLIYGMYNCINFTTEKEGEPGAVLIRAVEPLNKHNVLKKIRKTDKIINFCSGPGKLCQAFNITKLHNDTPLGEKIKVFDDDYKVGQIARSSRVGIKDALHLKWRFFIQDNEFVSKVKIK